MSSGKISSTICQNKLKIFQKSGLSSQENLIDSFLLENGWLNVWFKAKDS